MKHFNLCWTFGLAFALTMGCASPVQFYSLKAGPKVFQVEVAATPKAREVGLMNRDKMDADKGMIFVFPDENKRIFWMKDTHIPLSIAYISKSGQIKEILDMEAYSLAPVPSTHIVKYALEVNLGAFARYGVKVGDQVDLSVLKDVQAQ